MNEFGNRCGQTFEEARVTLYALVVLKVRSVVGSKMAEHHDAGRVGQGVGERNRGGFQKAGGQSLKGKNLGAMRRLDCCVGTLRWEKNCPLHLLAGLLGHKEDELWAIDRVFAKSPADGLEAVVGFATARPADDEPHAHHIMLTDLWLRSIVGAVTLLDGIGECAVEFRIIRAKGGGLAKMLDGLI